MTNKTSIAIQKETRKLLAAVGSKDSTFDEIIQELIKFWKEKN